LLQQAAPVSELPRSFTAVTVSASHIAFLDLSLNLRPSVAPLYHLGDVQRSSGGVAVVELKHYGVCLAAVNARVLPEIVEDPFRLIILQLLLKALSRSFICCDRSAYRRLFATLMQARQYVVCPSAFLLRTVKASRGLRLWQIEHVLR